MKHIHEKTGVEYEIGRLIDFDRKTFDMCVITKWDTEKFEESPVIIDYYFGEYDKETTDEYIDGYLEKQEALKKSVKRMSDDLMINREVMEPDDIKDLEKTIADVTEMISNL